MIWQELSLKNKLIYKTIAHTLDDLGYPAIKEDTYNWPDKDKFHIMRQHIQHFEYTMTDSYINSICNANSLLLDNLEAAYFKNDSIDLINPNLTNFFDKLKLNNIQVALNTGYQEYFKIKLFNILIYKTTLTIIFPAKKLVMDDHTLI